MLSKREIEVCKSIGQYYLTKNSGDYEKAQTEVHNLCIVGIKLAFGGVLITTARPGILIGKRGENIDGLEKHLGMKIAIYEVDEYIPDLIKPYPEPDYPEVDVEECDYTLGRDDLFEDYNGPDQE